MVRNGVDPKKIYQYDYNNFHLNITYLINYKQERQSTV